METFRLTFKQRLFNVVVDFQIAIEQEFPSLAKLTLATWLSLILGLMIIGSASLFMTIPAVIGMSGLFLHKFHKLHRELDSLGS